MRTRRHTSPGLVSVVARQRLTRDICLLVGIFIVGYGIAFLWLSPAPLIASERVVPLVIAQSEQAARRQLERLRFRVTIQERAPHPSIGRGHVVWQDPPAGVVLSEGKTVALVVSSGIVQTAVPDVIGLVTTQAEEVLLAAGFVLGEVDTVAGTDPGIVVATRPASGEARDPGSAIGLVVSGGEPNLGFGRDPRLEPRP